MFVAWTVRLGECDLVIFFSELENKYAPVDGVFYARQILSTEVLAAPESFAMLIRNAVVIDNG